MSLTCNFKTRNHPPFLFQILISPRKRVCDAQDSTLDATHILFFTRCHLRESVLFCWRTLLQSSEPKSLRSRSRCQITRHDVIFTTFLEFRFLLLADTETLKHAFQTAYSPQSCLSLTYFTTGCFSASAGCDLHSCCQRFARKHTLNVLNLL